MPQTTNDGVRHTSLASSFFFGEDSPGEATRREAETDVEETHQF